MQQYASILADNGRLVLLGTADSNWPMSLVDEHDTVPTSAFEVIESRASSSTPDGDKCANGYSVNCSSHLGYRMAAADGGVFSFGEPFLGSMGGRHLNAPIVGMAATPDGARLLAGGSDGGVFSFGDAALLRLDRGPAPQQADRGHGRHARRAAATGWWPPTAGSSPSATPASTARPAAIRLNKPIVGMAATADGQRLLAGGLRRRDLRLRRRRLLRLDRGACTLNKPIVGMAATPDGHGYWLVASDGGIFTYGDAGVLRLDRRPSTSTSPSWAWRPPPTATATGSWPPTAASSPTATPGSTARPAAWRWPSPSSRWAATSQRLGIAGVLLDPEVSRRESRPRWVIRTVSCLSGRGDLLYYSLEIVAFQPIENYQTVVILSVQSALFRRELSVIPNAIISTKMYSRFLGLICEKRCLISAPSTNFLQFQYPLPPVLMCSFMSI